MTSKSPNFSERNLVRGFLAAFPFVLAAISFVSWTLALLTLVALVVAVHHGRSAMAEAKRMIWGDEPGKFFRMAGERPVLWAAIGACIAWLEMGAVHISFFRAPLWPDAINANVGWVVLVTSTVVAAATFVFLRYFFAVGGADQHHAYLLDPDVRARVNASAWVIIAVFALAIGTGLTAVAFGQRGPWGHVMDGIRGPELPIDAVWWPVVFGLAAICTVRALSKAWRAIRDEALDIAREARPATGTRAKP